MPLPLPIRQRSPMRDDRVGDHLLARHDAGRQRDVRAEHRARADVDVALVHDRRRREADDAALAERPEAPPEARPGADRAQLDDTVPGPAHHLAGQPLGCAPQAVDCRGVGPHPLEHGHGGYC